jgi:hypothetical protein
MWLPDDGGFSLVVMTSPSIAGPRDTSSVGQDLPVEGVEVEYLAWVELLDLVGGVLPPDGRGLLTPESEAGLNDAGPGEGVGHDD